MNLNSFIDCVVNDGIKEASQGYSVPDGFFEKSFAGFKACRDKSTIELLALLREANSSTRMARTDSIQNRISMYAYWEAVCYEDEIEWVCNCVSAFLISQHQLPIYHVTAKGMMKAKEIIKRANMKES